MERNNTIDLWLEIKRMGSFSDKYYDVSIINDLRKELSVTSDDFDSSLNGIPAENFLMAFFKVMSPLVSMYADILNFFERYKFHSSTENIEFEFDLKRFKSARINAAHFIKAREQLVKVMRETQKLFLTPENIRILWGLPIQQDLVEESIMDAAFLNWYEKYTNNRKEWPSIKLNFASAIEDSPIQEALSKAFLFWNELFRYYESVPASRNEWYEFINDSKGGISYDFYNELLMPEEDLCLGSILYKLYYLAENYTKLSPKMKDDINERLDEFLEKFSTVDDYTENVISVWKSFLKLPVWKRRYEVYSVWVFTEIITGLPNENLTFNLKDGVLSFPFSGACLATVKLGNKTFDFWTELRTRAVVKPIGKGRKTAIQPDYTIVCGDASNISDSIAVIECKQYKRSSTINFSQAIIDYAHNRPNAKVFLVDYGEINTASLTSKLYTLPTDRYELMPLYRPESKNSTLLSSCVLDLLYQRVGIFKLNLNDIAHFSLFWNKEPLDLDLYLYYRSNQSAEVHKVCFNSSDIADVQYQGDITSGYGPEKICIKKWHEGIYDLWVNNYSETPILSQSNALLSVVFYGTNQTLQIECPKEGSGQWWHLLRIDTLSRTIAIINVLSCS